MELLRIRHNNYLPSKYEGFFRILVIGDSFIWGDGLQESETLPYILDEVLNNNSQGNIYEIINISECGWSIHDYVSAITLRAKEFKPDLILVSLCFNDIEIFQPKDYTEYRVTITNIWYDPKHLELFESKLQKVKEFTLQTNIPVVFFYYNIYPDYNYIGNIIRNICNKYDLIFFNLSEILCNYTYDMLKVSEDNGHPNYLANKITVQNLINFLYQNNLLPQPKTKEETQKYIDKFFIELKPIEYPYIITLREKLKKLNIDINNKLEKIDLKNFFDTFELWINSQIPSINKYLELIVFNIGCLNRNLTTLKNIPANSSNDLNLKKEDIVNIKTQIEIYSNLINNVLKEFQSYFSYHTYWIFNILRNYFEQLVIAQNNIENFEHKKIIDYYYSLFKNLYVILNNHLFIHRLELLLKDKSNYINTINKRLTLKMFINTKTNTEKIKLTSNDINISLNSYIPYYIRSFHVQEINNLNLYKDITLDIPLDYCYLGEIKIENKNKNIVIKGINIFREDKILLEYSLETGLPDSFNLTTVPFFLLL